MLAAGVISALGAALIAVVQRDIKKVLAYSTISQLGFMFAALGVGAWAAAFFHLITHAAFKGLLFLGSGSVIHGSGTQDLHEMGGLRKGCRSRSPRGLWERLRWLAYPVSPASSARTRSSRPCCTTRLSPGGRYSAASALTAFYMARSTRLAFGGRPVREEAHAHESPASMTAARSSRLLR